MTQAIKRSKKIRENNNKQHSNGAINWKWIGEARKITQARKRNKKIREKNNKQHSIGAIIENGEENQEKELKQEKETRKEEIRKRSNIQLEQ